MEGKLRVLVSMVTLCFMITVAKELVPTMIFVHKKIYQQLGKKKNFLMVGSFVVPLHAMKALGGRGGIAPTHTRPRH
jgi:hypothetical protein